MVNKLIIGEKLVEIVTEVLYGAIEIHYYGKLFIENFKNDYDEYKEIDEINIGENWTIH